MHVVAMAYAAVTAAMRGDAPRSEHEVALLQVLAGALPNWEGNDRKHQREVEEKVIKSIRKLQGTARQAVDEWRGQACTGKAFMLERTQAHGWLRLVVRAWREEAAHSRAHGSELPAARCPRKEAIAAIAVEEQIIAPAGRVRTCESSGINEHAQNAHEVNAGQAVAIGASAATINKGI